MKNEVIEMEGVKVWLGEDGIIRVVSLPGLEVTLENVIEVIRHVKNFTMGKKVPLLIDIRSVKSMTREARLFVSGEDAAQVTSAVALLIGSPASKVIGNFFIGFGKPIYPTKLFNSEEKALHWLEGFIETK